MTAQHVEVRVIGAAAAAAAVLDVIARAGDRRIVAGPGRRGPFSRRDGRVAFYGHLQVDVAAPAGPPAGTPAGMAGLCPEPGCGRRIGLKHGRLVLHYKGSAGRPVRCPGTGQPPAEDAPDA